MSATGTGKTVLSGLDVKNFNANRMLFVVHRGNIARKAVKTFQHIFGNTRKVGLYSGSRKEITADFLFCTVQTINKYENLNEFSKEHFDYIIIDETHRAGAPTYKKVLNHFSPKFLLGMTATPERTDGFDIFSLFDHNIGCEFRLNQAMEEDLVCPFHYFGVSDIEIDGQLVNELTDFNLLVSNECVEKIISATEEFGCDDGKVRGLMFCSRVEEAKELSNGFNQRGFKTRALSGGNSESEREDAINLLESDHAIEYINYIFTVDVFNEGIDMPKLNQIVILRPTQSPIVFVQQLGRGLRKTEQKEYLTVIDFIGNYQNNYMIPVALFGDKSLDKDILIKSVSDGNSIIPGTSTVNFDKISKEIIFESINKVNLRLKKDLTNDYQLMKFRLGRIPMMMDFIQFNGRDPYHYVEHSKSFLNFVMNVEENEDHALNGEPKLLLEYLSKYINDGKRALESLIIKSLVETGEITITSLKNKHKEEFDISVNEQTMHSAIQNSNLLFVTERKKLNKETKNVPVGKIYNFKIAHSSNGNLVPGETLVKSLESPLFSKYLKDSINYGLSQFKRRLEKNDFVEGFIRYQKYSRKDVFRILNWEQNPVPQTVGGYLVSPDKTNCPIFVNYHKEENISETTKYKDKFISDDRLRWESKSRRSLTSPDVETIINQKSNHIRLPLFVKKSNDEDGIYYYFIGDLTPIDESFVEDTMPAENGPGVSVVRIDFALDQAVEENLYNYIIKE